MNKRELVLNRKGLASLNPCACYLNCTDHFTLHSLYSVILSLPHQQSNHVPSHSMPYVHHKTHIHKVAPHPFPPPLLLLHARPERPCNGDTSAPQPLPPSFPIDLFRPHLHLPQQHDHYISSVAPSKRRIYLYLPAPHTCFSLPHLPSQLPLYL